MATRASAAGAAVALDALYENSFKMARGDELIYCEGWAVPDTQTFTGFPVLHAWVLNADGLVLETTWERPGLAYIGIPVNRYWHFPLAAKYRSPHLCEEINLEIPETTNPCPPWVHPVIEKGRPIPALPTPANSGGSIKNLAN